MAALRGGRGGLGGIMEELWVVWVLVSGSVVESRLELGDGDIVREVAGRRRCGWVRAFGQVNRWLIGICKALWGGRSNPLIDGSRGLW